MSFYLGLDNFLMKSVSPCTHRPGANVDGETRSRVQTSYSTGVFLFKLSALLPLLFLLQGLHCSEQHNTTLAGGWTYSSLAAEPSLRLTQLAFPGLD